MQIGPYVLPNRLFVAPMAGVTDRPFRQLCRAFGAGYAVSEMVTSRRDLWHTLKTSRRADHAGEPGPIAVQIAGTDAAMMAEAARYNIDRGAQIIDINMGCPAKEVTGAASGSALMRDLDLAESLIAAAVDASDRPVTVKMRLGWDDASRNAPELAARAEGVGAQAVTVHGRTRCQFYAGAADWSAVRAVKSEVSIPVIVNGDVVDAASAREALRQSGADAVMLGRGITGRPWVAAAIERDLDGEAFAEPGPQALLDVAVVHLERSIDFYGERVGVRMFRKHLAAYVEQAPWRGSADVRRAARARLCRLDTVSEITAGLAAHWRDETERLAA